MHITRAIKALRSVGLLKEANCLHVIDAPEQQTAALNQAMLSLCAVIRAAKHQGWPTSGLLDARDAVLSALRVCE